MMNNGIIIKFRGEVRRILPKEIVFLEQDLRKVLFHLQTEVCSTYGKLESYSRELPKEFYRCHRSYIINLNQVIKMADQTIFFQDGQTIRVGKQSFICAKKAFLEFTSKSEL